MGTVAPKPEKESVRVLSPLPGQTRQCQYSDVAKLIQEATKKQQAQQQQAQL